jgi:hypothetical protein
MTLERESNDVRRREELDVIESGFKNPDPRWDDSF